MRTTLKRGVGRGAHNGNGKAVFPPGTLSTVTRYRQPPPPSKTPLGLFWRIVIGTLVIISSLVLAVAGGALSVLPPVGRDGACAHAVGRARGEDARRPARPQGGDRARDRLRPPRRRRVEPAVALRHDHAGPRRSVDEDDLAALVPARPRRADLLPAVEDRHRGLRRVEQRPDQLRVLALRRDRHGAHGQAPDRACRSTS